MIKVQPSYSFAPSPSLLSKMRDFYAPFKEECPNEYVELFARGEGFVVQIYKTNKKGETKVLFQGPNAIEEARIWEPNATNQSKQPERPARFLATGPFF
jgi:ribonuclease HIII